MTKLSFGRTVPQSPSKYSCNMSSEVDVIIVGASLAGASLALRLGRSGYSSVLVDKASFPRKKACGDGLSTLGLVELSLLGVDIRRAPVPQMPFLGFNFFERNRKSALRIVSDDSAGVHGIGIERYYLDQLVLQSALATGQVEAVLGGVYELGTDQAVTHWISTRRGTFRSRHLVFATGGLSALPDSFGMLMKDNQKVRYGTKVNIRLNGMNQPGTEHVSIYLGGKFQACCTPVSRDTISISIMTRAQEAQLVQKQGLAATIDEILSQTGIDGEISGAPIGCANIGRFERVPKMRNLFTVGDAIRQLDPIGGMGMTHALVSSRVVASTIQESLHHRTSARISDAQHAKHLQRETRKLAAYSQLSYWSLVATAKFPLSSSMRCSSLARDVMRTMHKSVCDREGRALLPNAIITSLGFLL